MDQTDRKSAQRGIAGPGPEGRQVGAEGAFFLPHQDSEKADEIFGTGHQYTGAELSFSR